MRPGPGSCGTASRGAIPAMTSPCLVALVAEPANTWPVHVLHTRSSELSVPRDRTAQPGAGIRRVAAQRVIPAARRDSSTLQEAQAIPFLIRRLNQGSSVT